MAFGPTMELNLLVGPHAFKTWKDLIKRRRLRVDCR